MHSSGNNVKAADSKSRMDILETARVNTINAYGVTSTQHYAEVYSRFLSIKQKLCTLSEEDYRTNKLNAHDRPLYVQNCQLLEQSDNMPPSP